MESHLYSAPNHVAIYSLTGDWNTESTRAKMYLEILGKYLTRCLNINVGKCNVIVILGKKKNYYCHCKA